jgi:hypothetical protein
MVMGNKELRLRAEQPTQMQPLRLQLKMECCSMCVSGNNMELV